MRSLLKILIALLPAGAYLALVFLLPGLTYTDPAARRWLFIACAAASAGLLRLGFRRLRWWRAGLLAAVCLAALHRLALFIPDLSTTPWSLGWSEGSRYYYASLYFARSIYGFSTPTSVLHPSRYLLQSFPFLIPELPIWVHRLWQVLLWLAATLGSGLLLAWRLRRRGASLDGALPVLALTAWSFIFLMQGPVYYHLLVMPLLLLWGVQTRRFGRTLAIVLLASAWAGISRINWYPMPGLIAAALYFLEQSCSAPGRRGSGAWLQHALRYLSPPLAWTLLGSGLAYGTSRLYILLSGNPAEQFGSSFTSDLLWYRLYPNPTYPEGLLRTAILVSIPLGLVILHHIWQQRFAIHWLRLLGLGAILLVLLAGGLVVSVKIGGGSNLHNLDAYLVLLWLVGAYAYYGVLAPEGKRPRPVRSPEPLAWAALAMPLGIALALGAPLQPRDRAAEQAELETLRQVLASAEGEVLFINQRQLLTFHEVEGIALQPDYEVVFLMEMVMGYNQPYLQEFYARLADQRYAFIVTDPVSLYMKGSDYPFGEENDVWNERVSGPLWCQYEPVLKLEAAGVWVMQPRQYGCN
jgi:hypothetical protein